MIRPELEEAKKIAEEQEFQIIPISMELYSDLLTPIEVLRKLKNVSKHCYLLESAEDNQNWGRYTFLGYDPKLELTCVDGKVTITAGTKITMETKHPKEQIKQIIEENKSPRFSYLPTFTGGLVGYFSYDYIKYAENSLDLDAEDTEGFRDVDLMLFDKVIAFDHYRQKIILIVNAKCSDIETEYHRALLELESMKNLILKGKAKNYIRERDIFQVVLSNRMEAEYEGSLLNAYRVLRTTNPSPYMFYFSSDDLEIAGASPETLVKLEDGVVHTFPLAGTRPRGKTPEEDERLEKELLADEKECAEHNMLVDLGRNDIGKISEFGSVKVEKYMSIERFSAVMHIGSTVSG